MNGSREIIFARLRAAMGGGDQAPNAGEEIRRPRPDLGPEDRLVRFAGRLRASGGSLVAAKGPAQAARAVADYLADQGLPPALVAAPDPTLNGLPWPPGLVLERRPPVDGDRVALTAAAAGIAETGSLVMLSGPGHPTSLNFLPDHHIVLLPGERVAGHIEEVWPLLGRPRRPPRAVNLITGPSRTADIEQTIQLGAHGPRRLHVVLVTGR